MPATVAMSGTPMQKEYWSGPAAEQWATHADRIDAMMRPMTDDALRVANVKPGERVLDIGCGSGATSLRLAGAAQPRGAVTGVDISPQLLQVARTRAAQVDLPVSFIEADAGAAQFDQKFDAAFSRFGVMFFEQPSAAFTNIRKHLRDGGRITFICWRPIAENGWAMVPIEAITPMFDTPWMPPNTDAPGPFAFSDPAKVERILSEAGWRDIAIARWDGDNVIAGGVGLEESTDFLVRIGPCARAIAERGLDVADVRRRLIERLAPLHNGTGVALSAACWFVSATA
ncbi:class I SAM-dependent methyltransferase [Vitreimonas flagellata]|uniref:class I SAM-dependent methyltransferase n=1 Tax=Vitreimonas flagellata TaxID=2560861 RepID=UPI0010756C0A|nr:class I SAM-dependent methyltransferase [Vitreimonas flagellata]